MSIKYYTVADFPYFWLQDLEIQHRKRGNQASSQKYYYKDILTAFDIETTRIPEIDQSVMYVWQWAFGPDKVVIGRTWYDFTLFLGNLKKHLLPKERLLILVHNLSYEFSFLKGIYPFDAEEVFCMDRRKVAKCTMYGTFEFRCSYIHSNMSLDKYTHAMGVDHAKLHNFDYNKQRFWYTELDPEELAYITNDVVGLVEAASVEMQKDGDNFYSFPLTSTGYVRRDVKQAMRNVNHDYVHNQVPDWDVYQLLREEFRGGNTHSNRYFTDVTMTSQIIHSADRSSSYPDVICNCRYPISRYYKKEPCSFEELQDLIYKKDKAVLFRAKLYDVKLLDPYWGCPYLAKDKCRNIKDGVFDNGRILSCSYLETTINDIDLEIICSEYLCSIEPFDVYYARYGKLPEPLIQTVEEYYRRKTELKGNEDEDAAYYYMKSKNKLNSIYGLFAQDPVKVSILYRGGSEDPFIADPDADPVKLLEKHNRTAFTAYQWGCWTTSWGRLRLEEGIRLAHQNDKGIFFLYCDTDSVKYIGDIDWEKYNQERIHDSIASGAYADDTAGIRHYMGVFEQEQDMQTWRSLGSKKYAYLDMKGKLHITVAGVGKKLGAEELEAAGGLDKFREGFIFHKAGGMEAVYNDVPAVREWITPDEVKIRITSNVTLKPTTKTLGITQEYRDILEGSRIVTLE